MAIPEKKSYNQGFFGVSRSRCREILGKEAIGMADEQIDEILSHTYALGEILIDKAIEDAKKKKSMKNSP
jgi:hypothetical protein